MNRFFLITIDVEDWFQVENFKPWIPFETWDQRELRVERNVHRLLDLFDSIKLPSFPASQLQAMGVPEPIFSHSNPVNPRGFSSSLDPCTVHRAPPSSIHATFFVLCWLAERLPGMVREIAARGHEVASHGYHHKLPNRMSEQELKRDLIDSKKRLEDTIGSPVVGYRAPSFAINEKVLNIIAECGYLYDSSYNSFSLHGRYGKITLNGQPRAGIAYNLSDNFHEIPLSNLHLENLIGARCKVHGARRIRQLVLPWSGGAYFRLMPFGVFRQGVRAILERDGAYVFYAHPWEIDPDQPRVQKASFGSRFKHYSNLSTAKAKLEKLIGNFVNCSFMTCRDYLKERESTQITTQQTQ